MGRDDRPGDGDMAYDEHHDHDEYDGYAAPEGGLPEGGLPEGGLYVSASAAGPDRSARHRRRLAAGITAVMALLAGAGFLVTRLMNEQQPTVPEPAALAPQTAPATASADAESATPEETAPAARTPAVARHAAPVQLSPPPSIEASGVASPDSAEARASAVIDELRNRLRISERTRVTDVAFEDGTMRIVASWRDVTGESLLRQAGDAGTPAGNGTRCTTAVRNEPDLALGRPPTLMCWRTSTYRSVVVISSASAAGPDAAGVAADLIETEWPKPD